MKKRAVLVLGLISMTLSGSHAWAGGGLQDPKAPPPTSTNNYRPQPTPDGTTPPSSTSGTSTTTSGSSSDSGKRETNPADLWLEQIIHSLNLE